MLVYLDTIWVKLDCRDHRSRSQEQYVTEVVGATSCEGFLVIIRPHRSAIAAYCYCMVGLSVCLSVCDVCKPLKKG